MRFAEGMPAGPNKARPEGRPDCRPRPRDTTEPRPPSKIGRASVAYWRPDDGRAAGETLTAHRLALLLTIVQLVTVPAIMVLVHVIVGLSLRSALMEDAMRAALRGVFALIAVLVFVSSPRLALAQPAGPASRPAATGLYPR
jgi:hypothetical protein